MTENPSDEPTFEQSLARLEQIVHDLEDSQLSLDEALARYEQGVRLIKECHARLQQAEQRILLVTGVTEQSEPVLRPFHHEATAAARAASSPRSANKPRGDSPG